MSVYRITSDLAWPGDYKALVPLLLLLFFIQINYYCYFYGAKCNILVDLTRTALTIINYVSVSEIAVLIEFKQLSSP